MSDANMVGKVGWIDIAVDDASGGRFCIIEDPSGATAVLYQP